MGKNATIITALNGRGLEHDANIIKPILESQGYRVEVLDYFRLPPGPIRSDVAFWLENFYPERLGEAKKDILIPNQEYFLPKWLDHLPRFDAVFCKSIYAYELCAVHTDKAVFTGFTSRDLFYPGRIKPKEGHPISFVHLRGQSLTKGTIFALQAWAYDPTLPPLHVYYSRPLTVEETAYTDVPNIRFHGPAHLSEQQLRDVLNRADAAVCPSPFEGFGHYINEAMGCGCIVIATDGEPMSEHIRHGTDGLLAGISRRYPIQAGLGEAFVPLPESIADQAKRVQLMTPTRRAEISRKAREAYLYRDACFRKSFIGQLSKICP